MSCILTSLKPFSGFGWIETVLTFNYYNCLQFLLNPSLASAGLKLELTRGMSKKSISIRQEKVGIYTVSYVSVNDLEKACKQYNFKIQSEMIEFLKTYYKDWTIVLCTWSGTDSISAQPVVITFNSAFSLEVYIPMTDGHGTVPKHGDVDRNHKVGIGVQGWSGNYELDTVKALGFSTFSGNILEGNHPNGDIYIDLNKSKTISNQLWNKFVF